MSGVYTPRAVADAVLYEGYLLYPYRAGAPKNRTRWQFGVLGPAHAAETGLGEDPMLAAQWLVDAEPDATLSLAVRFLHSQHRQVLDADATPVVRLDVADQSWLTWDEAVEQEIAVGSIPLASTTRSLTVPGGIDTEVLHDRSGTRIGSLVRTRVSLTAELEVSVHADGGYRRVGVRLINRGHAPRDRDDATARSLIGTHVIADIARGRFLSLLDSPSDAATATAACERHRCFPVLAGPPGTDTTMLVSPIILYDHPQIAEQTDTDLFDSTEIDEILTLRVMTLTDEEKQQARATDPLAARIIDRCDAMGPDAMARLHGTMRGAEPEGRLVPEIPQGSDWWNAEVDAQVAPDSDAVLVDGVRVSGGSRVVLHPSRRADAQDVFYEGRSARVVSVHADVDGHLHLGVVLDDDPAADLHESYGRYLYFAPDEVEPIDRDKPQPGNRGKEQLCKPWE